MEASSEALPPTNDDLQELAVVARQPYGYAMRI